MQGLSDVLSNTVIPALTGVLSHSDEIMAVIVALQKAVDEAKQNLFDKQDTSIKANEKANKVKLKKD